MSPKPIRPRRLARRDVETAIDYYAREAGPGVALGFVDALKRVYRAISAHPGAGSPRYAYELGLPGLRVHGLGRYPHLVFYIEREDYIDVWRVLHARRDIPSGMQDPGG